MGNLLNRLFGNESREAGCKRPFSKHNKVNLHNSSSKSKFYVAYSGSVSDEAVLLRKSFKSPSVVHAMHRITLVPRQSETITITDYPISQMFQESSSNAAATANHPVVSQEVVHRYEEEDNHQSVPEPSVNPETSPFQRDFITAHQPLVSLEKSRPRRSNIRRSSRMNASIGKGDNVSRPLGHQHQLSSVPSILGDDESTPVSTNSHQSGVISNRADPSLPVLVSHNNQSGKQLKSVDCSSSQCLQSVQPD